MEFLWNNTGATQEQHANNAPTSGWVSAGEAGGGRKQAAKATVMSPLSGPAPCIQAPIPRGAVPAQRLVLP